MLRDADRIAARSILAFQPEPIQTLVASFSTTDGPDYTVLVRRWSAGSVARCRLCRNCTAKVGSDDQAVCIIAVEGSISEEGAPLFSAD